MMPLLVCSYLLENKSYEESNTTPEELAAMKSRISILDDKILQYVELPKMTIFSINVMFDELDRYISEGQYEAIYFDLSSTHVPNIHERKLILERFAPIVKQIPIFSFATGKSPLLNIAIKFILNVSSGIFQEQMFVSTKEEAIFNIYEKLGKK